MTDEFGFPETEVRFDPWGVIIKFDKRPKAEWHSILLTECCARKLITQLTELFSSRPAGGEKKTTDERSCTYPGLGCPSKTRTCEGCEYSRLKPLPTPEMER